MVFSYLYQEYAELKLHLDKVGKRRHTGITKAYTPVN